jgi:hypothetical protein
MASRIEAAVFDVLNVNSHPNTIAREFTFDGTIEDIVRDFVSGRPFEQIEIGALVFALEILPDRALGLARETRMAGGVGGAICRHGADPFGWIYY